MPSFIAMNLTEYRNSVLEIQRTEDILRLIQISEATGIALDIGARDGYFSLLLTEQFSNVIAFDLTKPEISHPRIKCEQGNAINLEFADESIDFVFCAEVLEHIPSNVLSKVCSEIERVCRGKILIGVPYKQDIRVGRTTCRTCKGKNPPWGHVNTFDEQQLFKLFPNCKVDLVSFVGKRVEQTNVVATILMDLAGNPYGTYEQDETCIHCNAKLTLPPERNLAQKILTKLGFLTQSATLAFHKPRGNWIHLLLSK